MEYNLAREYMNLIEQNGSVYGLETMRELLARLDNPQKKLKFIHVAGTNGKGSVTAYLTNILTMAGYRTGRYTSPAVFSEQERFCVNNHEITKEQMGELVGEIKKAADSMVNDGLAQPTLFEIETALAFLFFAIEECDIAVVECGLGGALDATNVIDAAECAVITSVSYDHMAILGRSIQEIAWHKAGIIHEKVPVVSMVQKQEVDQIIKEACKKNHSILRIAGKPELIQTKYDAMIQDVVQVFRYHTYEELQISLLGQHQLQNVAASLETIAVLRQSGYQITDEAVLEGLRKTRWPGRFTRIHGRYDIYMDGAHNEAAALELAQVLKNYVSPQKWVFIMGMFADKDYEKVIERTASYASCIYTITLDSSRSLSAEQLAKTASAYNDKVTSMKSLKHAVKEAIKKLDKETGILAFGSLSFLKNFKEEIDTYMIRVDKIINNNIFLKNMKLLEKLEQNRTFCRHDWSHSLDVARIAYIINLERQLGFSKEIIYASALLHDLGRVKQYEEGIPHEQAGMILAEQILTQADFEKSEIELIIAAISTHSYNEHSFEKSLSYLLYHADKKSRRCFDCLAAQQCNWEENRRNDTIVY